MENKPMYLGVAYYPEMWDEETWDDDITKMQELGINCVRIAEFAWSTMEPKEGEFDFSLFRNAMDKMESAGISVILCTPTSTPPKWLTDAYPETVRMLDDGHRLQFGARGHSCRTSRIYREKTKIIVSKMCQALADHPAVIGWQIDNEIYPYEDGCFCNQCVAGFHKFMAEKYGTIENLNRRWGTCRWSLTYGDFEDIIPPRKDTWNHPSLQADWLTFQAETIIDYVHMQKDEISKYTDVPVGTDMMYYPELDHCKMNEKLDIVQFNHYETQENLWYSAFWFDYMRTIKEKPFWCTETQLNWFGASVAHGGQRAAGNVYANTILPYFMGGEMNLYWLWRTHPCGHEMMHGAVLDCAGRLYHTTSQVKQAAQDLQKYQQALRDSKIHSDVAIHFSADASIQLKYVPMTEGFEYLKEMRNLYRNFLPYNVDVIGLDHSLDTYKVLISPYVTYINQEQRERILKWVKQGGRWIVGPMSNVFDDALRRYTHSPFGFLEEETGIYCKYSVPVDHNDYKAAWTDGTDIVPSKYFDGYEAEPANHLATYTEGDLSGLGMITEKKYGEGTIVLVGSCVCSQEYVRLTGLAPVAEASDNIKVNLRTRANGRQVLTCLELCNRPGKIVLDKAYRNLNDGHIYSGELLLEAYQAVVLEEV